jgi:hypothetical protein
MGFATIEERNGNRKNSMISIEVPGMDFGNSRQGGQNGYL